MSDLAISVRSRFCKGTASAVPLIARATAVSTAEVRLHV